MPTNVTYKGPTNRKKNPSTVIVVDGVRFDQDRPVAVKDDALVKELTGGSDRLKGHSFEAEAKAPANAPRG